MAKIINLFNIFITLSSIILINVLVTSKEISSFALQTLDNHIESEDQFPNDWNITFNLFTSKNPNKQIILNFTDSDTKIKNSGFDPNFKTKFVVHGFQSGFHELSVFKRQWMKDIKDYILDEMKANVICVDWSKPASNIDYVAVLPNVETTGKMIAHFIKRLIILTKASPNDMHCIGHSLGAHVCGFVGKTLSSNKLAQISGLDPAWLGFDTQFDQTMFLSTNMQPLSSSDANLVLVIHTSAGIMNAKDFNIFGFVGNPNALGHYDFRINGGNSQPMCQQMSKTIGAVFNLVTLQISNAVEDFTSASVCPHQSSYIHLTARPNKCQFIAYKCLNYEDFEDGKCGDEGMPLEFNFNFYEKTNKKLNQTKLPNNLFIKTGESYPYCLFHYQIVIQTEGQPSVDSIRVSLSGRNNKTIFIEINLLSKNKQNLYYHLYTSKNEIGKISKLTYLSGDIKITKASINYMSHIDKSVRKEKSSKPAIIKKKRNYFLSKLISEIFS